MRRMKMPYVVEKMTPVEMWSFERLTRFPR